MQALQCVFNDCDYSYNGLLAKANRSLMYTHRLRCILSFIAKCIARKGSMCINDLFVLNTGSNSKKLKKLVQPNYNSKHGCNCFRYPCPNVWSRVHVDDKVKLTANFHEWSLACTCFSNVKFYVQSMFIVLQILHPRVRDSLFTNDLYCTVSNTKYILLTHSLTHSHSLRL